MSLNGTALRRQMQLRGLTAAELAGLTGLSPGTISNALAGRSLHPRTFRKIAAELAKVDLVPGAELLAALRGGPDIVDVSGATNGLG